MNTLKVGSLFTGWLTLFVFLPKYFHIQDYLQTTMSLPLGLTSVVMWSILFMSSGLAVANFAFKVWPEGEGSWLK